MRPQHLLDETEMGNGFSIARLYGRARVFFFSNNIGYSRDKNQTKKKLESIDRCSCICQSSQSRQKNRTHMGTDQHRTYLPVLLLPVTETSWVALPMPLARQRPAVAATRSRPPGLPVTRRPSRLRLRTHSHSPGDGGERQWSRDKGRVPGRRRRAGAPPAGTSRYLPAMPRLGFNGFEDWGF